MHSSENALAAQPAPALTLADFDFDLPPELIAQQPAAERSGSRLLVGRSAVPVDRHFTDLPGLLQAGDLLVFNNTRVIKARLLGVKVGSGGVVEALVERVLPRAQQGAQTGAQTSAQTGAFDVWAHVRASKSPRPGAVLRFADAFEAVVLGRAGPENSLFHLRFPADPQTLLQQHGHVPLPPYISHADTADDERRYQTVFAQHPGAVAAPTAALHFDAAVLSALQARGVQQAAVTLHVGAGTFQPVREHDFSKHRMHSEWFEVSAETVAAIQRTQVAGGRVLAVGTTTLRALESAAQHHGGTLAPFTGETTIFITPGYRFSVVDTLLTNFHLPKSTLMMLVSAFAGHAHVMALYRHAIAQRYRFFSYGDCMLLHRA